MAGEGSDDTGYSISDITSAYNDAVGSGAMTEAQFVDAAMNQYGVSADQLGAARDVLIAEQAAAPAADTAQPSSSFYDEPKSSSSSFYDEQGQAQDTSAASNTASGAASTQTTSGKTNPAVVIANAWNSGDIGTVNQQIANTNMTEQQAAQVFNLSAADIANAKAEGVKFAPTTDTTVVDTTTGKTGTTATTAGTTAGTTTSTTSGTTAGTTAGTTTTTTSRPVTVVDYQGNSFDSNNTLSLASQIGSVFDKTSSSGGAWGTKGEGIGFEYDQARSLLGKDPTAAQQVLLDMSRYLQQAGVTDLRQVGVRTVDVPETILVGDGENIERIPTGNTLKQQEFFNKKTGSSLDAINETGGKFGETYTGKGATDYYMKADAKGNIQIYTKSRSTSDADMINAALMMASFVPGLAPFASLVKTGIALDQGNILGALTSSLGIPGVSDFLPDISGLNIPGIPDAATGLKVVSAFASGDPISAAAILTGSQDAQMAAKAVNVLKALESGNQNALMGAIGSMASYANQPKAQERASGGSIRGGLGQASRHLAAHRIAASKPGKPPTFTDVSRLQPINKPPKQATIRPVDVSTLIPIRRPSGLRG